MKRIVAMFVGALVSAASPVFAQSPGWTVEFGGGVATPTSDISSRLSTGWGVDVGLGYQFTPWFTVLGEFAFAGMGVPSDILQQLQAPQGQGRIYSLNVDPQVSFPLTRHLQGFVEGGVGSIRRTVELTSPMVEYVDSYDPFYGDLGPQAIENDQGTEQRDTQCVCSERRGWSLASAREYRCEPVVDVKYYRAQTSPRVTAMPCAVWHSVHVVESAITANGSSRVSLTATTVERPMGRCSIATVWKPVASMNSSWRLGGPTCVSSS